MLVTTRKSFAPRRPNSLEETGLSRFFLSDLILKTIYQAGGCSTSALSQSLKLPYYGILEPLVESLRDGEMLFAQAGKDEGTFDFVLTRGGRERALQLLDQSHYVGPAPVPLAQYRQGVEEQTVRQIATTRTDLRLALAPLVLDEAVVDQLGPAMNSGTSVFLFGESGNGKTSIAELATTLLGSDVHVPYSVEVDSQVIQLYDPNYHRPPKQPGEGSKGLLFGTKDARWVLARRPVVAVGGELTLAALDLIYEPRSGFYEAPLQLKANCGAFIVDDFGRQQIPPRDLLNRWIVPLEQRVDYLTLHTGKKVQVPFDVLVFFCTNLQPTDLVDEAFLRRIRYKIRVKGPSEAEFREIFMRVCGHKRLAYDDSAVSYLIEEHYARKGRGLRACHPRDLVSQILDIAAYRRETPALSRELIDLACRSYFVDVDPVGSVK